MNEDEYNHVKFHPLAKSVKYILEWSKVDDFLISSTSNGL